MRIERSAALALMLAAVVWAADMATKAAIVAWVDYGASHPVLPMLNIVHVLNRGAAFSFLHDAGGWQRPFFIIFGLVACAFLVWMIQRRTSSAFERRTFALILGGAFANVTDRVIRGAVVDWIDVYAGVHHWPAFNIADMGITLGAGMLLLGEVVAHRRARAMARKTHG